MNYGPRPKYANALTKGDGRAHAALFTSNGIEISPLGQRRVIEAQAQEDIDLTHKLGLTISAKSDNVEPLSSGQSILVSASYTATFTNSPETSQVRGNMLFVLERAGDDWKIRAVTFSRLAANAPAK